MEHVLDRLSGAAKLRFLADLADVSLPDPSQAREEERVLVEFLFSDPEVFLKAVETHIEGFTRG